MSEYIAFETARKYLHEACAGLGSNGGLMLKIKFDQEPKADVIEVVRCRDCKYMCHYTDGHLECRLLSDLKPIPTTYCTMNAEDFCSYGERREDAEIH